MYEFMEFLGGFCGVILDIPVTIFLLIILVCFIKNKKTKQRGFFINLGIVFVIGFCVRLLVLPININDSSMGYSYHYFGVDTAFFMLFSNAIFAVLIYILYCFLKFFVYVNMTPEETREYEDKKKEIEQVKILVEKYENAKDFECADFLYRLMIFRDSKFNSTQIQAFLNPEENKDILKSSILKKIKIYMSISEIINPNNKIAYVWFYTLNSYISDQNKELMQKLWSQLKRGFELAKPKYLQDSCKYFNFDNSEFYQAPKGMD